MKGEGFLVVWLRVLWDINTTEIGLITDKNSQGKRV